MGSAITKQAKNHFGSSRITVCDTNAEKLNQLAALIPNLITHTSIEEAVLNSELIILATKPQHFPEVAEVIKKNVSEKTSVLSIMAGISTQTIGELTGLKKIIRAMPNTPLQLGKGVTGWYATPTTDQSTANTIVSFLETFGIVIACRTEDDINKITAISGSGPAYFFYATECLMEAAKKLGFSEEDSQKLALNTLFGAAAMLEKNPDPRTLKENVMSKGGTTEAALASFENNHFLEAWYEATEKAYQRALELAQKN